MTRRGTLGSTRWATSRLHQSFVMGHGRISTSEPPERSTSIPLHRAESTRRGHGARPSRTRRRLSSMIWAALGREARAAGIHRRNRRIRVALTDGEQRLRGVGLSVTCEHATEYHTPLLWVHCLEEFRQTIDDRSARLRQLFRLHVLRRNLVPGKDPLCHFGFNLRCDLYRGDDCVSRLAGKTRQIFGIANDALDIICLAGI